MHDKTCALHSYQKYAAMSIIIKQGDVVIFYLSRANKRDKLHVDAKTRVSRCLKLEQAVLNRGVVNITRRNLYSALATPVTSARLIAKFDNLDRF